MLAVVSQFPGGFQATWDLVTARYARRLKGQMTVKAEGQRALIEYTNRVDPGFLGVALGTPETTVRRLQETVQALAGYVERLRMERQETLKALAQALESMVREP